ncbi:MAG: SDR family oxidoreductase [Candidatus Omnitrophota bacterium]
MKKFNIQGSIVLITGANRGIGKAFAEELIKRGVKKIYAGARNIESLKELTALAPERIKPVRLDVTNESEVLAAAAAALDVNVLINNAGRADYAALVGAPDMRSARGEMEVNYFGLLNMVRAFQPVLKRNGGGQIINISSVAGLVGIPALGTYSATKAAVHSLTQSLRGELAAAGTIVTGVYPGATDTEMTKDLQLEKTSPAQLVNNILESLEKGEEDIFPDKISREMALGLKTDAKTVEKQWAQFLP